MASINEISINDPIILDSPAPSSQRSHQLPVPPPTEATRPLPATASKPMTGRDIKNRISGNCLALLQRHLGNFPLPRPKNPTERAITELQALFLRPLEKDENERRKQIQHKLCEILKTFSSEKPAYRDFVYLAGQIIHNLSEAMSVFEAYGASLIGEESQAKDAYNYGELLAFMETAVKRSSDASVDSLQDRIFTHSFRHPERALATWLSERASADKLYNPYETGNQNAFLGRYCLHGTEIGSSAGPNPSHSDYTILPALLERNADIDSRLRLRHLQTVLEGAEEKSGAKKRRESVVAMEEQHKTLATMTLPLDGEAWKGKGLFADVDSAASFYGFLFNQPEDIYIPELIPHRSVQQAGERFLRAFSHLEGTSGWEELRKAKTLSKTLLLGFNACLILSGIESLAAHPLQLDLHGLPIRSTCNMACKQGIDRGAIQNLMVRMLVDAHERKDFTLSQEQLHQYCGYIAGRAVSVEGRRIQKDRFVALTQFVRLIASATPEQRRAFLRDLELPADMCFVPSHK